LADGQEIRLIAKPALANTRDHTLLPTTLDRLADLQAVPRPLPDSPRLSLDAGHDYSMVHLDLPRRGIIGQLAQRGAKALIRADGRVVERTSSWMNDFAQLRRCSERRKALVEFFIAVAGAVISLRSLIRRACSVYRWDIRPRSPRIRGPAGGCPGCPARMPGIK
jgi:hypothetical protein